MESITDIVVRDGSIVIYDGSIVTYTYNATLWAFEDNLNDTGGTGYDLYNFGTEPVVYSEGLIGQCVSIVVERTSESIWFEASTGISNIYSNNKDWSVIMWMKPNLDIGDDQTAFRIPDGTDPSYNGLYIGHAVDDLYIGKTVYEELFRGTIFTGLNFLKEGWNFIGLGWSADSSYNVCVDSSYYDNLGGDSEPLSSEPIQLAQIEWTGILYNWQYTGQLDQIRIFPKKLSEDEYAYYYNNGNGR